MEYLKYTQNLNSNALGVIKNDLLKETEGVDNFIIKNKVAIPNNREARKSEKMLEKFDRIQSGKVEKANRAATANPSGDFSNSPGHMSKSKKSSFKNNLDKPILNKIGRTKTKA